MDFAVFQGGDASLILMKSMSKRLTVSSAYLLEFLSLVLFVILFCNRVCSWENCRFALYNNFDCSIIILLYFCTCYSFKKRKNSPKCVCGSSSLGKLTASLAGFFWGWEGVRKGGGRNREGRARDGVERKGRRMSNPSSQNCGYGLVCDVCLCL